MPIDNDYTHSNCCLNRNGRSIRLYLGGSFDPPHYSHIAMLQHVYQTLNDSLTNNTADTVLAKINNTPYILPYITPLFLPTARSPLKQKRTSAKHRLAMLQLACSELNRHKGYFKPCQEIDYQISEFEIWQTPPTYTIQTLKALRQHYPEDSLIFILGADSVASLDQWRLGSQLTKFAHLWVMPRDNLRTEASIRAVLPKNMQAQIIENVVDLLQRPQGGIYIDSVQIPPLSSSVIRDAIADKNNDFLKSSLPRSVYSYIIANKLYQ